MQPTRDKAAALDAEVAGEPGPREELPEDNQDAMAMSENHGSQAEDDMFEAEANRELVTPGMHSRLHTSTRIESQNDNPAKRQEGRAHDSKLNNALPNFPYFEYLHPPSSILQPPTIHPLKQPHIFPQANHHSSSSEDSSEAETEMLDSDMYSTPPQPIPQRIRRNDQLPTADPSLPSPSSQLPPRDLTPSSQPTDPRARLEITDSQQ